MPIEANTQRAEPAPPAFNAGGGVKFYAVLYTRCKPGVGGFFMNSVVNSGRVFASPQEAVEAAKKLSVSASGDECTYYVAEVFAAIVKPKPQAEVVELK